MERLTNEELEEKIDETGLKRIDFARLAEISASYLGAICNGKVKVNEIKANTYYRILNTAKQNDGIKNE